MELNTADIRSLIALAAQSGADNTPLMQQLLDLDRAAKIERVLWTYTNNAQVAGAANFVAAGVTSAPVNTPIDASAMFLWTATSYNANSLNAAQTAATRVYPNCTVLIIDTGSGRQLMDNPVPVPSLAGDGQFPFILPEPRWIAANSTIQCVYTNFDVAAGFNIRLAFHGYKVYKLTQ